MIDWEHRREYQKAWVKAHPEKMSASYRRWQANHPEKSKEVRNAAQRRWYQAHPEVTAANKKRWLRENPEKRKAAYKRSLEKRLRSREALVGRPRPDKCEICERENVILSADHCHATGKYRGWICHSCNLALGNARDNPDLLRKMASWLENFKEGYTHADLP